MNAIRIRKQVDSETLHLPELKHLIGKTVDITITEAKPSTVGLAKELEFFMALAPKRPQPTPEEKEKLKGAAKHNKALAAILEIAEDFPIDIEAIAKIRAVSMI